jgi:RNA polymerase sigma-70 factor (sigma-E family)
MREEHGMPETLDEFLRAHSAELLRFSYLVTQHRELSEDLVQDVLVSVVRTWPRLQHVAQPEAYLRRMLVNAATSWRRRRMNTERPTPHLNQNEALLPDIAQRQAERDALWTILARLPVRQRTVMVLRYYEDADDESIAEVLGVRPATVRSLAHRALNELRAVDGNRGRLSAPPIRPPRLLHGRHHGSENTGGPR